MNRLGFLLTALVFSSALVACPSTPTDDSFAVSGILSPASLTGVTAVKVYPVLNPRRDLFDTSVLFTPLQLAAAPIAIGTISTSNGVFNISLPSSSVMQSYGSTRQLNAREGCTITGATSNLGQVAQVIITLHNSSGTIIGYLAKRTPGERTAGVVGTFYDVMHYWSSAAFIASMRCPSTDFEANLQARAGSGWNIVSYRTTTQPLHIFDRINTVTDAPAGTTWEVQNDLPAIGSNAPVIKQ